MFDVIFDVIIYHNNCLDGFASFFCFWKFKLLKKNYRAIPDKPSATNPPPNLENKNIVIVDVAYKNEVIEKIVKNAKNVVFIDHHKTIIDDVKQITANNLKIIYDINECGASLSWEYCTKLKPPTIIKLIKDNDIGIWNIKETKPFITAIGSHLDLRSSSASGIKNLKKFELLLNDDELNKIIEEGKNYISYKKYLIKEIMQGYTMKKLKFKSNIYNVAVLNTKSSLNSEIGRKIAKLPNVDFSIIWYYNHKKKIFILSFRSTKVDVGEIAKSYGGGGHKLASACSITTFIDNIFK